MEHNFTWKNDGRTKVMIGCGTRPEIIRLAAVIKRCREYFDCCVVYYNQNWDRNLSTVFWEDFELKNTFGEYGPDILVPVVGENLGVTCGNILGRSYELLSELQPEGYLVLGDTNSCLSAISAKRLHIPLFHMEAGNRCKDECLPEETNRRIVDLRREYVLFRVRPEVSGGYRFAQGAHLPDRLSNGRSVAHESGEDPEKRCAGTSGTGEGQVYPAVRPP